MFDVASLFRRLSEKRWLRGIAACGLAMILLEGLCWGVREKLLPPKWSKNEDTDRMEPGFRGTIDYADTMEGRGARLGYLSVNSLGFRGAEPKLSNTHSPNRLRVYCLGSSTTFGWGASSDADTYPAQLEKILQARFPNYPIEVINAGVPGNKSKTELKLLKEDLPRLHPDVVILWSGWPDWTHYLASEEPKRPKGLLSLLEKSNTFRWVEYTRDLLTPRAKPPAFETFSTRAGLSKFRQRVLVEWLKNLEAMTETCAHENTQVFVLGLASPLRYSVDSWNGQTRQQASNRLNVILDAAPEDIPKSLLDFEQALKAFAARHTDRKNSVTLIPAEKLPDQADLFFDGVHMKDSGYAALAEAVANQLKLGLQLP